MKILRRSKVNIFVLLAWLQLIAMPAGGQTASTEDWLWSRAGGGINVLSAIYDDPVLNSRNEIIVCGTFLADVTVPITFDSSILQLFPAGSFIATAFLGKYEEDGTLQWAQSFQSGEMLEIRTAVDGRDNIYFSGRVKSFIQVDTLQLVPSNTNDPFIFLMKFNNAGELIWAKIIAETLAGTDPNVLHSIELKAMAVDPLDQVLLFGNFAQPSFSIGDSTLPQLGFYDIFLTQLDEAGNVNWIKRLGADSLHDFAQEMVVDLKGNIYTSTTFQPVDIVMEPVKTVLSQIDVSGDILWKDTLNPGAYPNGLAYLKLSIGPDNSLYTVASYKGSFLIDGHALPQGDHIVIGKLSPDGTYAWLHTTGATSISDPAIFPAGIACDSKGAVYIAGTHVAGLTAPVTDLILDTVQLINQGGRDFFFAKFDSEGSVIYADNIGGINNDGVGGLALDKNGNAYLTGYFNSSELHFNGFTQLNPSVDGNTWGTNHFLVKFGEKQTTGIKREVSEISLRVFPNPAPSSIRIQSSVTIHRIRASDYAGRVVYDKKLEPRTMVKLNVENFPAGLYMLQISTAQGVVAEKLSIAR